MTNSILKKSVMQRVYIVYWLRVILQPLVLKSFVMGFLGGAAVNLVSLGNVLKNFLSVDGVVSAYDFSLAAIWNTRISVQLLVFVGSVLFVSLSRDIVLRIMNAIAFRKERRVAL